MRTSSPSQSTAGGGVIFTSPNGWACICYVQFAVQSKSILIRRSSDVIIRVCALASLLCLLRDCTEGADSPALVTHRGLTGKEQHGSSRIHESQQVVCNGTNTEITINPAHLTPPRGFVRSTLILSKRLDYCGDGAILPIDPWFAMVLPLLTFPHTVVRVSSRA